MGDIGRCSVVTVGPGVLDVLSLEVDTVMSKPEHTQLTELHMVSLPGSRLEDCMYEAVLMACKEWHNVVLTHHGRKYRVLCNDLLSCVKEYDVR